MDLYPLPAGGTNQLDRNAGNILDSSSFSVPTQIHNSTPKGRFVAFEFLSLRFTKSSRSYQLLLMPTLRLKSLRSRGLTRQILAMMMKLPLRTIPNKQVISKNSNTFGLSC